MQSFTVTLTRAHKYVQRLNMEITERIQKMNNYGAPAKVTLVPTRRELGFDVVENGEVVNTMVEEIYTLLKDVGAIRVRLGQENEKNGVSASLSEVAYMTRMLSAVSNLVLSYQRQTDMVTAKDTMGMLEKLADNAAAMQGPYGPSTVTVKRLDDEVVDKLQDLCKAYELAIQKLQDDISDLNSAKIVVIVSDLAAKLLGEIE